MLHRILAIAALAAPGLALAQPVPRDIFAPFPMPDPVNEYRSAGGVPGPAYWQNRADTEIHASIDTAHQVLSASETITYTNNSPDTLDVLWVQLDQNTYKEEARYSFTPQYRPRTKDEYTQGDQLDAVTVESGGKVVTPAFVVTDTRLQIRLPAPLAAKGGKLKLHIAYHYTVPGEWGGRTAVTTTKNGDLYEIAQWFPRMAVYDDLRGWDTAPYIGQEFYLEYGDIDYYVTVPWNYLVEGSGALQNPGDVLTKTERDRLAKAATSDATIYIRAPSEVTDPASRPVSKGNLTWHFKMLNTRDVAFAASPAFVWDAAGIKLPGGKHAMAMSIYPVEGVGKQAWDRSTQYVKAVVEYFSGKWFPYPWPQMVNLGGHGAGMEYPGIVFDDMKDSGKDLFWISAHEIGHSWFPMIVGSNERRHAWMDEGFNTFIDVYASDFVNHGEFAPKRDPEYAPGGGNPVDEILPTLIDAEAPPILTQADSIPEKYRHPVTYFKAALGLVLLREQILGPDRFDPAFRKYIAAWAYKHPSPSDFFRLMNSEAGEDLSYWWRGWYTSETPLQIGVTDAAYVNGDFKQGLRVRLQNLSGLVMPISLELVFADGSKSRVRVPVEAFMQTNAAVFDLSIGKPVTSVTLDPDHVLPMLDRRAAGFTLKP